MNECNAPKNDDVFKHMIKNFDVSSTVKNNTIRRYSTESIILKFDELPEIN